MFRRLLRLTVRAGLLAAAVVVGRKVLEARNRPSAVLLPPRVDPTPWPEVAVEEPIAVLHAWVDPVDGACPTTHPIKAKLASKVFRRPGGPGYDKSRPDRCYGSPEGAEADGFTEAQR